MKSYAIYLLFALALLAVVAAGCGGANPAPAESTAVPPTAAPATDTPAAPAAALPSPAPTLGPGVFTDALNKAKTAAVYRFDMQTSGSGTFNPLNALQTPEPNVTPTAAPADQLYPLIAMKGEVNGKDSHAIMQGVMASFIGADPNKGLELTIIGDKAYVHGPAPMLGADQDKWYEMPASQAATLAPGVAPGELFDQFTQTGLNPNDFKKSGSESLDGHSCDVYSGDQAATLKTFQELNKQPGSNGQTPNFEIDKADFRFWVCDDSYLHQVRLSVDGHQKDTPALVGTFLVQMHIYDLNSSITITAPTDAIPLPTPAFGLPGETPTP